MRSSKSRSRSKSNRQRSPGNVINRVFDSSGPESKVRGTPQQIIDKYLTLARDAQLSNDRVAEQNFLQHAEHYTRLLGEAQREMAREQEQRQQNQSEGGNNHSHGQQNNNGGERQAHQRQRHDGRPERGSGGAAQQQVATESAAENDDGPGLVETPEARQRTTPSAPMMPELPQPQDAKPAAAEKKPRAPRKPREKRPAAAKTEPNGAADGDKPADAAE